MTEPRVGRADPSTPLNECRYAPDEVSPRCTRPAEFHVIVRTQLSNEYPSGYAGLPVCLEHLPIAESCGVEVMTTHRWGRWCGFPQTWHSVKHGTCYLDTTR